VATLREKVKNILEADTTLMSMLSGGVFDAADFDRDGMSRDDVPTDADDMTILPFATIRYRGMNDYGPRKIDAERGSVEVYIYQDVGYGTIEAAAQRVKTLLNRKYIWDASDYSMGHLVFSHVSGEIPDEGLGNAPCKFVRFSLTRS